MSDIDTWENYPDTATIRANNPDGSVREWEVTITHGTLFFYVSSEGVEYRKFDGTRRDGGEGKLILTSMTPTACIPNKASVD